MNGFQAQILDFLFEKMKAKKGMLSLLCAPGGWQDRDRDWWERRGGGSYRDGRCPPPRPLLGPIRRKVKQGARAEGALNQKHPFPFRWKKAFLQFAPLRCRGEGGGLSLFSPAPFLQMCLPCLPRESVARSLGNESHGRALALAHDRPTDAEAVKLLKLFGVCFGRRQVSTKNEKSKKWKDQNFSFCCSTLRDE
jgi:hypothetical protein